VQLCSCCHILHKYNWVNKCNIWSVHCVFFWEHRISVDAPRDSRKLCWCWRILHKYNRVNTCNIWFVHCVFFLESISVDAPRDSHNCADVVIFFFFTSTTELTHVTFDLCIVYFFWEHHISVDTPRDSRKLCYCCHLLHKYRWVRMCDIWFSINKSRHITRGCGREFCFFWASY